MILKLSSLFINLNRELDRGGQSKKKKKLQEYTKSWKCLDFCLIVYIFCCLLCLELN